MTSLANVTKWFAGFTKEKSKRTLKHDTRHNAADLPSRVQGRVAANMFLVTMKTWKTMPEIY